MNYAPACPHIVQALLDAPWAILPDKLAAIAELIEIRALHGERMPEEQIEAFAARSAAQRSLATHADGAGGRVAVIPITGVLAHRASMLRMSSGGTSVQQVGREIAAAVSNPSISAVVLDIDSPGGVVQGVQELADQIFKARDEKPIVAVANAMAASAAYWIGTQASELVVTPSGAVGSIGVVTMHQDLSAAAERAGIRTTIIHAGRYKAEGNRFEPLGADARAAVQEQVDAHYSAFVDAVARGRGVETAAVREGFGQGRTVLAKQAVKAGMADRVATLDQTIARLAARAPAFPAGTKADHLRRHLALLQ